MKDFPRLSMKIQSLIIGCKVAYLFPTRLMDVSVAPRDSLLPLDASLLAKELERAQTPSFDLHNTCGPT